VRECAVKDGKLGAAIRPKKIQTYRVVTGAP
jgi:hypothetical protein